eukprot:m.205778 g.205778  ORF g.205778 m.205778 type:complete len:1651 (-) comp32923_c7_seq1:389-5341(-)
MMKLSVAILCAAVATTNAATLQDTITAHCNQPAQGRIGFVARWLDDGLGQGLRWNCVHKQNLEAQTPSYTCVDDDGVCQKCIESGTDVYSGAIPDLVQPSTNSTYMLEQILEDTKFQFYCPAVTNVALLDSPAAKITITQNTRVAWQWADPDTSNAHGIEIYRGTSDTVANTLVASSALPYSREGNFDLIMHEVGTFYWTDAVFAINGLIVVEDANECEGEGRDSCFYPEDLACENSQGSFICQNRCGSTSDCANNQTCTDIDSEQACQCDAGYTGSLTTCYDYDECDMGIDSCLQHEQQYCANTEGSFDCQCNTGWFTVGDSCEDVDECSSNATNTCSDDGVCTNSDGSYMCACSLGFTGDGETCEDVKECDTNKGGCDDGYGVCHEQAGSFYCSCVTGLTLNADNTTCDDNNECATVANGTFCGDDSACTNTISSFTCSCDTGFTGTPSDKPDRNTCVNVNECNSTHNCDDEATCSDTDGSFTCACDLGYTGSGLSCSDNNECDLGSDSCNEFRVCVNTDGSFTCEGFDECTTELDGRAHNCHANAKCTNQLDGFACQCSFGYEGNGTYCSDVDECAQSDPQPFGACGQVCHNTVPGYRCSCDVGFALEGFKTCTDVDECNTTDLHSCSPLATCANTAGSFDCSCKLGYFGNGTFCEDIDECDTGADTCADNGACTNNDASFSCECNTGFSGDGTTCVDVDECDEDLATCRINAACNNTIGSFSCSCDDGWGQGGDDATTFETDGTFNCTLKVGCASDPCPRGTCSNVNGSFACDCDDSTVDGETFTGYKGPLCTENANECVYPEADPINDCAEESVCQDVPGSFSCGCNVGYSGTGVVCDNMDECALDLDNCDANAACIDNDGSFTCVCSLPKFFGNGVVCQKSTSRYELTQKDSYLTARVGNPIVLEVRALDHFGNTTKVEQRDVALNFDTSTLYRDEDIASVVVDVVDGFGTFEFYPPIVGFYNVTMVKTVDEQADEQFDHSNAYAEIKVAVNTYHTPEPDAGTAVVSGSYSFLDVNCEHIDFDFLKEFAVEFSTYLMYWPTYAGGLETLLSTPTALGVPDDGGAIITFDRTLLEMSAYIGMEGDNYKEKSFRATLFSGKCSAGNQNAAIINQQIAGELNDKITMVVQCDARGVCAGSTHSPWLPDPSLTELSYVVFSDANGNTPAYCADLSPTVNASFLTLDGMTCGQEELPFLVARRGVHKTLKVDFSFTVPDHAAKDSIARFEAVDVPALKARLDASVTLKPHFNGSVVAGEFSVRHNGIDCNVDDWNDWSDCTETCNTGREGTQIRSKHCPPSSEVRICDSFDVPCPTSPTCDSLYCSADADCVDDADVTNMCECQAQYIGDGVGPKGCIAVEVDYGLVKLQFNDQVTNYAPTISMQRILRDNVIEDIEAKLDIANDGRLVFAEIDVHYTGNSFVVSFLVSPRTFESQTTAETLVVQLALLVSEGGLTTAYGDLEIEYTPEYDPSEFRYPADVATFTTTSTVTTSTATITSATATSATTQTTLTTVKPTSAPTRAPTQAPVTPSPSVAPTASPTSSPFLVSTDASENDQALSTNNTLLLLGCLFVVFLVLMAVAMVGAVKQRSKAKMHELVGGPLAATNTTNSTVINPASSPLAGKFEPAATEENKWLDVDSRYDTTPTAI